MKRCSVLSIVAVACLASTAAAQRVAYMEGDEPAFSLTYPDGWEIRTPRTEGRNVISAYPTDGSLLWQGMWIMRESTSVEDAIARLQAMEKGLFEDAKLSQEPWAETVGGLEARCYKGTGKYQGDKPVESFMALFELPGQRVGVVAYIGEPDAIEAHQTDLANLMGSLEAAR